MRLKTIKNLAVNLFMSAAMVLGGGHGQDINRHGQGTSIKAIMELVEAAIKASPRLQRAFRKYTKKTGKTSASLFEEIADQKLETRTDGYVALSNHDFAMQFLDGAHPTILEAADALFEGWNKNNSCPCHPTATPT